MPPPYLPPTVDARPPADRTGRAAQGSPGSVPVTVRPARGETARAEPVRVEQVRPGSVRDDTAVRDGAGRSQFAELFGRVPAERSAPAPRVEQPVEIERADVPPVGAAAERGESPPHRDGPVDHAEPAPVWLGVARGVAGVFAALCLHAAFGEAKRDGFDGRLWWVDLSALFAPDAIVPLPDAAAAMLLSAAGSLLGLFVVRPQLPGVLRWGVLAAAAGFLPFTVWAAAAACRAAGGLTPSLPAHLSACLVTVLLAVRAVPRGPLAFGVNQPLAAAAAVLACGLSFPLVDDPPAAGQRGVANAVVRTAAWWGGANDE